ncbi:MAG: hypothetical protein DMG64_19400 [Acidobacteria bacterium]|nr:MAG: hypothetical protein DMG64_19400 [Acidobacteriota bacterium]PYY00667.1 MAG: hypothetical protein DMG63_05350 [Acidobacteriota bacterium]PYY22907.1 MAG: hypothetical protein DMG62_11300 [Acidobacteriota bacterium]
MPVPEETASRRETLRLVVRKTIAATPERLFAAWTKPEHLKQWWGPQGVICIGAAVDLRVGGRYRIGNRLPDGKEVWITGEYRVVEPPTRLVYTWQIESTPQAPEIVTVSFERREKGTEVIVIHEHIPDASTRSQHEHGWQGCLAGLAKHVVRS